MEVKVVCLQSFVLRWMTTRRRQSSVDSLRTHTRSWLLFLVERHLVAEKKISVHFIGSQPTIHRPFSKPRLRLWIRLRLAWPRIDNYFERVLLTRSGLQTRGRSLNWIQSQSCDFERIFSKRDLKPEFHVHGVMTPRRIWNLHARWKFDNGKVCGNIMP